MSVVIVRPSTCSPRAAKQLAEPARHRGEHDIVDRAAERDPNRLDVVERDARALPSAGEVRSDR